MQNIVITGSTTGIGFGLADSFLAQGCSVVVSGRSRETVENAVERLSNKYPNRKIIGFQCDVKNISQVQSLWDSASAGLGTIDIWINNAGVAMLQDDITGYTSEQIDEVVDTNIKGTINGSIVALREMKKQGSGAIYNLKGLGSDGRIMRGLALYGLSKSAVGYFTNALIKEAKGTPVIVGGINPGMVATRLITAQYAGKPEEWARVEKLFNILCDRVETVTPWIVERILGNTKNGARISWLNGGKLTFRFFLSPFRKRRVFD